MASAEEMLHGEKKMFFPSCAGFETSREKKSMPNWLLACTTAFAFSETEIATGVFPVWFFFILSRASKKDLGDVIFWNEYFELLNFEVITGAGNADNVWFSVVCRGRDTRDDFCIAAGTRACTPSGARVSYFVFKLPAERQSGEYLESVPVMERGFL